MNRLRLLLLLALFASVAVCSGSSETAETECGEKKEEKEEEDSEGIAIVHLNFEGVKTPLILVCWVLLAVSVKVLYHSIEKFAKFCPESCVLIIIGFMAGLGLKYTTPDTNMLLSFDADIFFLFLLPPIVLDAGYCMPPRHFFDNIGLILAFAIFGTVINSFGIGLGLHFLIQWGAINVPYKNATDPAVVHAGDSMIDMPGCLLFGSLIAAVDPVAVMAVFDTVHVNEVLHIVVEGESLLNDAVSVVLYKIMGIIVETEAKGNKLETKEYGVGFIAFLVISGGGTLIGLIYAVITSVFTRTLVHVRVVEPLVVFFFAYLSYLTAELFHWSGILAIIFCGFGMRHYVEENISRKSHTTIKYFMKMLAVISESVIFMFLGLALVSVDFDINWGFIGFTIILCLFFRSVVVVSFVYVSNMFRVQKIAKVDQFIMVYGGLRGAISFSLAFILTNDVPWKNLVVTTTFAVIIFTVFIQGITIGPLVKLLHVRTHEKKKPSLNEEIIEHIIAHVMWGFEEIVGKHGENYYRQWFDHIDNTYLLRWLTNKKLGKGIKHGDAIDILQVFHNLEERDAMVMARNHEVFDNINRRGTSRDTLGLAGNTKAPQLPSVGESVPCADPNVKYQKLDSSINIDTEEHQFNQIKDKTFAAMKLNARPVPKTRHYNRRRINDMFDDTDEYAFYGPSQMPVMLPVSHHNMPYHAQAPIHKKHHHHGRKHHGDHHGHRSDKKHHHPKKDSLPDLGSEPENGSGSGIVPVDADPHRVPDDKEGEDWARLHPVEERQNTMDSHKPDEVNVYDFNDTLEIDPRVHDSV